jgi:hypothetical protein
MVRVPVPERYALHKLIVSQLRSKTSTKPEKDLRQAAILIKVLAQGFPGALEDASEVLPNSALRHVSRALEALTHHLPKSAGVAWDTLQTLVKRLK